MKLIEQYKAAIITFLITGTVVLAMFSIQLKQQGDLITESYYELEPEPELPEEKLTEQELENFEDPNAPSTNKAFNEDQEYKDMMRNFKTVSSNDFERTTKALDEVKANEVLEENSVNKSYANSNAYALNSDETESYKKLQEELKKRLENKKTADEHAKSKSTLTYSLIGRVMQAYDIPRYLCEKGGRIVVNIEVNGKGKVTDASINGSSSSRNQCLIERALEYAKDVRFDSSSKTKQIGTITFRFRGKR
ncbi:energy transducer TonB family protein [Winogradskyella ouciana]|uniref:TonB family protein n=1 Tax=Winogradskyella ouciana TaxID=2608631 RepID=A0A7K1GEJ4_9FLAO|nr:energy transducer TonB [Winogradskyella ouciana]MTE26289.1 TonB family protein [Winogradskyella ouciana]